MRPSQAVAQIISLTAIGNDARRTQRPGAPDGAELAVTRCASSPGARRAIGPSLNRANGSGAEAASRNSAVCDAESTVCARARLKASAAIAVDATNVRRSIEGET